MGTDILLNSDVPFPLFGRGKVRDTYDLGEQLLIVTTDRVSAFDCVMPNGIPDKGKVLTQLSEFWFNSTAHIIRNHMVSTRLRDMPPILSTAPYSEQLDGRVMLVHKAMRLDFECVVRGYLAGSGWSEYQSSGTVCGIALPAGLKQAAKLESPIFTPATKAESGHDINVSFEEMANKVGESLASQIKTASLAIYSYAAAFALQRGIIIADTKMEFGLLDGQLILIDELLTPDSSRFWSVASYEAGQSPPSFDKQYLRDWLEQTGWDKQPPAPVLPAEVVSGTASRYRDALRLLTGRDVR